MLVIISLLLYMLGMGYNKKSKPCFAGTKLLPLHLLEQWETRRKGAQSCDISYLHMKYWKALDFTRILIPDGREDMLTF